MKTNTRVIGTAGHIDHGKSALVHRLTGIDPDRLEEEKRRGMTIDLGFAWLTLPSGQEVSIVDVPGHERFVKNMLAGAAGIDIALLIVAADEGVMPQTREHLDILDLLEVSHGVVALTKIDLVDDEWRVLIAEQVRDLLAGTTLEQSPIVPVSSTTGDGIPDLLEALDAAVARTAPHAQSGIPHIPVDRVFTITGFGTVVTGTLHNASVGVGDEVELVPGGKRMRIRGLQTHQRHVQRATPGSRVAVNLAGVPHREIRRGDVLARPGTVRAVRRVDAHLRVLLSAPFSLQHASEVTVHVGAAERSAILSILHASELAPGDSGWVQLRFAEPVGVVRGQRFILRLPAPARTVAGGQVVDVAPRHRRSDPSTADRLSRMASDSLVDAVQAGLPTDQPRSKEQISALLGVGLDQLTPLLDHMAAQGTAIRLGTAYVSPHAWADLTDRVKASLAGYHQQNVLRRGMPREQLRSEVGWNQTTWSHALRTLEEAGLVVLHGSLVALPGHVGGSDVRRDDAERILQVLNRLPFSPPSVDELLASAQSEASVLRAMQDEGEIIQVSDDLYFSREAFERMRDRTVELICARGEVTVAEVRDALGTSRKYTVSVLEHLDAQRTTRRLGDVRVLGSKAPACE